MWYVGERCGAGRNAEQVRPAADPPSCLPARAFERRHGPPRHMF